MTKIIFTKCQSAYVGGIQSQQMDMHSLMLYASCFRFKQTCTDIRLYICTHVFVFPHNPVVCLEYYVVVCPLPGYNMCIYLSRYILSHPDKMLSFWTGPMKIATNSCATISSHFAKVPSLYNGRNKSSVVFQFMH